VKSKRGAFESMFTCYQYMAPQRDSAWVHLESRTHASGPTALVILTMARPIKLSWVRMA